MSRPIQRRIWKNIATHSSLRSPTQILNPALNMASSSSGAGRQRMSWGFRPPNLSHLRWLCMEQCPSSRGTHIPSPSCYMYQSKVNDGQMFTVTHPWKTIWRFWCKWAQSQSNTWSTQSRATLVYSLLQIACGTQSYCHQQHCTHQIIQNIYAILVIYIIDIYIYDTNIYIYIYIQ